MEPLAIASHDEAGSSSEPNPQPLPFLEPPPGWQIVRHASGHPCYVHLKSRVVMHSPPYAVPDDVQLDAHNPPDVVRRALNSLPRGANADSSKRPRTQAPVVSEQPAQITSLLLSSRSSPRK